MKPGQRKIIYEKYGGHCAYCGESITIAQMQVDHFFPKFLKHHYGLTIKIDEDKNLMPSCRKCNNHKGGMDIEVWRKELSLQVSRVRKYSQFDRALRFGQILITEKPIEFYFEKFKTQRDNPPAIQR